MRRDEQVDKFAGATVVDGLTVAELAARAQVDPRTVRKRLRGEKVRGLAGARIDRALTELRRGLDGGGDEHKAAPSIARAGDQRKAVNRGAA